MNVSQEEDESMDEQVTESRPGEVSGSRGDDFEESEERELEGFERERRTDEILRRRMG